MLETYLNLPWAKGETINTFPDSGKQIRGFSFGSNGSTFFLPFDNQFYTQKGIHPLVVITYKHEILISQVFVLQAAYAFLPFPTTKIFKIHLYIFQNMQGINLHQADNQQVC